jgi:large subunit ribosomal protein L9
MDVQVVLTETDAKLGRRGQVIKVSSGYAANFLYPQKKAVPATPANLRRFEEEKARQAKERETLLDEARRAAEAVRKVTVTVAVLTGADDKLYGAVTAQDIAQAAAAAGLPLEKRHLHLEKPIKKLGAYEIPVKFHPDVAAALKLQVVKKPA